MNPPTTRIRKHRAPRRLLLGPRQTPSVSQRRSSRIESRQRSGSVSISRILGSLYESQNSLEKPPTDPRTSQSVGSTSHTRAPTVEASPPVPSKEQFQDHQTRKRSLDRFIATSIETSVERPPKRARLTKKNLKTFEKMGGQRKSAGKRTTGQLSASTTSSNKDSDPQRKSKQSDSDIKSTRSKQTTSTTESGFQDIAFQNGILNPNCSKPPANLESLQAQIDRSRETASPSESDYRYFASAIRRAPNEASVLYETSALLQRYDEPGYHKSYNQAFSNFPKNIGFNNDLSAAQPDMVEGLGLMQFDPFPAREQLGGAATVYAGPEATTLPHLAGEWKGPGKDMILAQTQAAYDGACMVYGRNKARSFLENPDPASHAFVSTFTTDGTTLNTFAHYSSETQDQLKYHQFPISSSFLISSYEDFKKSRRWLRNLQDNAKDNSEKLRDELNMRWSENQQLDEDEDEHEDEHENEDEIYEDSCELVPPPASAGIPAECSDEEGPTSQLLTEYWMSFSANDQDDPLMQISTADNGYTSPDALITPPQSLNNTSHPVESKEEIDDSNVRGHRRTRRTRTQAADSSEGLRDVGRESNVRKTRRKH